MVVKIFLSGWIYVTDVENASVMALGCDKRIISENVNYARCISSLCVQ
jgi:hypothetical protein